MSRSLRPPPLMAIALGDPAGMGLEIVLKAADPETFHLCRPLAVGPVALVANRLRASRFPARVRALLRDQHDEVER